MLCVDYYTVVWVNDNYGYMKRVSNTSEQMRKGRLNHEQVALGNLAQGNWAARQTPLVFDSIASFYKQYNICFMVNGTI